MMSAKKGGHHRAYSKLGQAVGAGRTHTQNSTLTVQRLAFTDFAKLRLNPSTTMLSANCTCAKLRTISLGLQRF